MSLFMGLGGMFNWSSDWKSY